MTGGDPNSPLSPAWWWGAVIIPTALGARWLISFGAGGAQTTIQGQQQLLTTLKAENVEQAKRIEALEARIDRQGEEIDRLRRELSASAGITPAA